MKEENKAPEFCRHHGRQGTRRTREDTELNGDVREDKNPHYKSGKIESQGKKRTRCRGQGRYENRWKSNSIVFIKAGWRTLTSDRQVGKDVGKGLYPAVHQMMLMGKHNGKKRVKGLRE